MPRTVHTTALFFVCALALLVLTALPTAAADQAAVPLKSSEPHFCGHDFLLQNHDLRTAAHISVTTGKSADDTGYDVVMRSASGDGSWEPIRIGIFTADLDDSSKYCTSSTGTAPNFQGDIIGCTQSTVLTDAKKSILKNNLIPDAVQLHTDRLKVQPLSSPIVVPTFTSGICSQFTIPESHHTTGVSGYDFVLYIAAGPISSDDTGMTIAWATTCADDAATGRPLVGVSNISPKYIADDHDTIRVVAHEILHAMGFSSYYFTEANMKHNATIRQKADVPVITSPKVVAAAKEQYGCNSLTNMELEDGGGAGTAGSHWKRRNAKDELMAGISSYGYYTALTIAAMEDLGYYQGDYSKAEVMPWGLDAGCSLMSDMCMTNKVSLDTSMFCTGDAQFYCTSARTAIGGCRISKQASLPSWAQNYGYFNTMDTMDYCPYVDWYTTGRCTDGSSSDFPSSNFGPTSRCLDIAKGSVVCAAIVCSESTYTVQFKSGGAVQCTPGRTVSIPGTLRKATCPQYYEVCDEYCTKDCKRNGALAMVATGCSGVLLVLMAVLMAVGA